MKQYAEEKFSATSLSSTNIKNENTKSRNKKEFRGLYPNTPIRFGSMETANFQHIGVENVVANLMIHSTSPQGRRLVEQMYTDDPFSIDIKLDSYSKNRSAEIVNTYLKSIGRRMRFTKTRKNIKRISISPITFIKDPVIRPIRFIKDPNYNYEEEFLKNQKLMEEKIKNAHSPIKFMGRKKRGDE